ncbi:MAG: hypothetical protein IT356_12220 [Gemmatimonadaceae bacterium]|nr:hypothetical protein [Gemmatimonadaceae bacterium]
MVSALGASRLSVPAVAALVVAAWACSGDRKPSSGTDAASASRAAGTPVATRPEGTGMLDSGTAIRAMLPEPLSSLIDRRGQVVQAIVTGDVIGPDGKVAVPSGSRLDIRIDRLEAARTPAGPSGVVRLSPLAVYIQDDTVGVEGTVDSVPFLARDANVIVERATPLIVRIATRLPRRR